MTMFSGRGAAEMSLDKCGPTLPCVPVDLVRAPERSLLDQIASRTDLDAQAPAIDDGVRRLSRRELLDEVAALAAVIAARVPAGAPVGVRLQHGASAAVTWLACLAAGCPAVLLDAADAPARAERIAASSGLAAVISDRPMPGYRVIAPAGHRPAPFWPRRVDAGAPAFVVWTSGSTGRPKGIVHSQRSVLFRSALLVNSGQLGPDDRYLSLNAPASMGALLNAVAALLSGACLHRLDLAAEGLTGVLDRIERASITAVIGVPALYRSLCRLDGAAEQMRSLRLVSSNGDALLAADLDTLRATLPASCHVQMIYGATETQAAMRFVPGDEIPSGAQVAAGMPIPGVEWAILDDDGRPVSAGEVGELWIRSRYTAIGEWQDGQCVPGRLQSDGDGYRRYAMGDLVRVRGDGALVVVGRKDRQVKIDGLRIEPVEVEAALRAEPEVLDAVVIPLGDGPSVRLTAFVAVGDSPPDGIAARLRAALAGRLPSAMRPQRIHVLRGLPMLAANKIDTAALRHIDAAGRIR